MTIPTDICLIIEGSYPFVTGGVASWIHRIINSFEKDFTFSIVALTAGERKIEESKYPLPDNVLDIVCYDIFDYRPLKNAVPLKLSQKEKNDLFQTLRQLLSDYTKRELNSEEKNLIEKIITQYRESFFQFFLTDEDAFSFLTEVYQNLYGKHGFLKFWYNWRNIFLTFSRIFLLSNLIPKASLYHSLSTGFAGFICAMQNILQNKPSMITEHGIYVQERTIEMTNSTWLDEYYLKKMWIDFFKNTTLWQYNTIEELITLYNGNRQLEIDYGAPADKIKVIPNGIEVERFAKARRIRCIEKPFKIGTIARVDPIKDLKTFINCIAVIKGQIPEIQAYIVGPNEKEQEYYLEECHKLISMLELESVITFTGRADVVPYYEMFDVLLLTSIKEAMPLSVMEGMACGLPVVCTNVGACKELIFGNSENDTESCGFVSPIMDSEELAIKTIRILNNPEMANKMGKVGIQRIETYYQEEMVTSQYHKIYSKYTQPDPIL